MQESQIEVRKYLIDELREDFIGPHKTDEELSESPIHHYMCGILYPKDTNIDPEEDRDSGAISEEDDVIDTGTLMATASNPSAFGMTFTVEKGAEFQVICEAAKYEEIHLDDEGRTRWKRQALDLPVITIRGDKYRSESHELNRGLRLDARLRVRGEVCVITLSLVNEYSSINDRPDPFCFFQPKIRVEGMKNEKLILPRTANDIHQVKDDYLNQLLYRHSPEYAIGHGCAVTWQAEEGENARWIETNFMPDFVVQKMTPDFDVPIKAQEMLFLSEANEDDLKENLKVLTEKYSEWIDEHNIDSIPEHLKNVADENIEQCRKTKDRIERGIELISKDPLVREAFQLANKAMLIQRARINWIRNEPENRPEEPALESTHKWRPFQLAFILMVINSIANPKDKERLLADLLWFPTGGGKTEAYLGLTAFTIFLRRLRNNSGENQADGVTVLMRYTLRLLTIQQFQRASSLIMACEHIRREKNDKLGNTPISLGLWVGAGVTPNHLNEAKTALQELLRGGRVPEGNPYQIQVCPWCGTKITPRNYSINREMSIQCPNPACEFKEGLPLYLIDDDVYRMKPSLVIATVDKFARLPWLDKTSSLFGKYQNQMLPPELIIQDELHLITGPLGTMVGLYETAIDILTQNESIPAKVIASTATIRQAESQIKGLYKRTLWQFPPQALDARDSFFSHQISQEKEPGRCFVGAHTPGKSMKTALLRIYSLILQRVYESETDPAIKDPYWTLVGYFNSMRELGSAIRLVEDDVRIRMKLLAKRHSAEQRELREYFELNSRTGADEIPKRLEDMTRTMKDPSSIDVLLATNMISVGMDVDRLGLMVVTGQPKMTSEYIQATSRVGRKYPGLIITLYNWSRPRDRSHFERFIDYHSKLYSQVEPVSVTPFSNRARDKGLHGVFISLVRHMIPEMNDEDAARQFNRNDVRVQNIMEWILERVEEIDPNEVEETRLELNSICDRWEILSHQQQLVYGEPYNPHHNKVIPPHLMEAAEKAPLNDPLMFPTLNSLRNVEGESGVYIIREREETQ